MLREENLTLFRLLFFWECGAYKIIYLKCQCFLIYSLTAALRKTMTLRMVNHRSECWRELKWRWICATRERWSIWAGSSLTLQEVSTARESWIFDHMQMVLFQNKKQRCLHKTNLWPLQWKWPFLWALVRLQQPTAEGIWQKWRCFTVNCCDRCCLRERDPTVSRVVAPF